MRCREKDETGQPKEVFVDVDGMTTRTGDTPVIGKCIEIILAIESIMFYCIEGKPKATLQHHIENRNIGAHIVCGSIDTFVSINTNDLLPGGANIITEVTKRCIEIAAEMLAKSGLVLPKRLSVQYDNCGENKVCNKFRYKIDTSNMI